MDAGATGQSWRAPSDGAPVFALAAALWERIGEPLPDRQDDMSALIERLRLEIGHPAPRLADTPRRVSKPVH